MTFNVLVNGTATDADKVNENMNKLSTLQCINLARQLQDRAITFSKGAIDGWGESYVDADGRKGSVSGSAVFDTNKYKCPDTTSANLVYVDIYATSVVESTLTDLANSVICYKMGSGIWRVISYKNSLAEATNRLLTILFRNLGDAATNPNGVTGFSSIRISESTYRNKKAIFIRAVSGVEVSGYCQATFSATDTNTAYVIGRASAPPNAGTAYVKCPIATGLYAVTYPTVIDYYNTSTISNITNADGIKAGGSPSNGYNWDGEAVMLFSDTITVTKTTGTAGPTYILSGTISISGTTPDTTTYPIGSGFINHTIPTETTPSTISKIYLAPHISDWESGADIRINIANATESSAYQSVFDANGNIRWIDFTAFTSQATTLNIQLIPKSISPTVGYPAIYGFGALFDK